MINNELRWRKRKTVRTYDKYITKEEKEKSKNTEKKELTDREKRKTSKNKGQIMNLDGEREKQ